MEVTQASHIAFGAQRGSGGVTLEEIAMRVLVAYATRSGGTRGIAERIAERLRTDGHEADVASVADALGVPTYGAYIVGSAVYLGRWEKDAVAFVEANAELLAHRPTWLFSSGPLGTDPMTASGYDKRETAVSAEMLTALTDAAHPRGHRVFGGVLEPDRLSLGPRLMRILPAGRRLLEEGDFRDWAEIEAWTDEIASELAQTKVPVAR
jgi:menaquinone-dependent protoporphyrinogen oxidase